MCNPPPDDSNNGPTSNREIPPTGEEGAPSPERPTAETAPNSGTPDPNSDAGIGNVGKDSSSSNNNGKEGNLGSAKPTAQTQFDARVTKEYAKNCKQDRKHRNWLFFSFMILAGIISVTIIHVAYSIFDGININNIMSEELKWKPLIPLDAIVITLAAMFLTIFITLVRFVETGRPKDNSNNQTTTTDPKKDETSVIKAFTDLVNSLGALARAIKGAIKTTKP